MPHQEWGCDSLVMHILMGNGNVPHREFTSSLRMGMCLTGNSSLGIGMCPLGIHILNENGDVPHREFTSSLGMWMCLTGNSHPHWEWDVPHQKFTSSPGMGIGLSVNAYSLYRVKRLRHTSH